MPLRLTGCALTLQLVSIGAEYSTLLRPSDQVSQWRTNRWSKTWPLALVLACASRRDLVQARSAQSRNTARLSARRSPCGDKRKLSTSSGKSVTLAASPPVSGRRQTCEEPERPDRK